VVCGKLLLGPRITAREMMFGVGEEFVYLECESCGSLQIQVAPASFSKYYPSCYYSFAPVDSLASMLGSVSYFIGELNQRMRLDSTFIGGVMSLPKAFLSRFADPLVHEHVRILGMTPSSRILDVGCANGMYLISLRLLGFRNLVGIDPYIAKPIEMPGLRLLKKELYELEDNFDFIVFNHSFEHIPSPERVLRQVHRILENDGKCMIRTPIVPSFAWNNYRAEWIQLDPPRHSFIVSRKGALELAKRCGFRVSCIRDDSNEMQFWGSEQYRRGIPFMSPQSHYVNPRKSIFNANQIHSFKERASELNARHLGDQAEIVMEKVL
jgi:2-polyprenyl-3-methyl-5-hydroxy-6-metoxy-1,4-benzoquinol methylase